jgi:o-succinylbenzoate synthase
MNSNLLVEKINLYHINVPLTQPYHLSFDILREFHVILVEVSSGGHAGYGESVPLYGYSDESFEDVWGRLISWKTRFEGMAVDQIFTEMAEWQKSSPFSCTPLLTALEMLKNPIHMDADMEYPLLGTLHSSENKEMETEINHLLAEGYRTIKVKVGMKDVDADINKLHFIQEIVGNRAVLRIDANQAYHLKDAQRFVTQIDPGNVELFEQPFHKNDWDSMKELSIASPIPLMLDESINSEEDIDRVIESRCAQFVKFKLMKAGSMGKLEQLIKKAQNDGLKVVLGNGVAGEVGNFHEILIAHSLLQNAGEMNGFLKQKNHLLNNPLQVINGKVRIPKGYRFSINTDELTKLTVNEV